MNKNCTIWFSDVQGFVTLGENKSSEDIAITLNQYYKETGDVILANKGEIIKYAGDQLIAVFNGKIDLKDHAKMAVRSALEVVKNDKIFTTAVSLNTGEVYQTEIGHPSFKHFDRIGDNMNLCARMLYSGKQFNLSAPSVIISEFTYELIKDNDEFECKELGSLEVKGKKKPVNCYQVLP